MDEEGLLTKTHSDKGRGPSVPKGPYLGRQNSAVESKWSHSIMYVLETGTIDQVRDELNEGLVNCPESLISQSMRKEHALRTPLMAAAASGDFAMFTAVKHAVDRAINLQVAIDSSVIELERHQLEAKDQWGLTLAMLAARNGTVSIMKDVLERIAHAEDHDRLLDSDHRGKTVLMHAAGAGRSATFEAVLGAIGTALSDKEANRQLLLKSGDDRNMLMHAARGGDQMGVTAVVNAFRERFCPFEVRTLVEDTDGEGMTFLMHGASGARNHHSRADRQAAESQPQALSQTPQHRRFRSATDFNLDASFSSYTSARQAYPPSRLPGVTENSKLDLGIARSASAGQGVGGSGSSGGVTGGLPAASDDPLGDSPGQIGPNAPGLAHAASQAPQGGEDVEDPSVAILRREKGMMYPSLVVFKTVWSVVKEVLWKEQIREQLRLNDSWGRTILTHAVLSGRVQLFQAAFCAMKEHILDSEIEELLDVNKEDHHQSIMEAALEIASKEMAMLVGLRDQQLKKSIAEDRKASTIEAKIQSFIPGKLIVIFQLLLPEVETSDEKKQGAFILLLILTAIAPFLSWASHLVRVKPAVDQEQRHSKMTLLLSAPAIFFWGIATSNIGTDTLGWSETASASALAVATIVIPGLDAFAANRRVEQWLDKWSCRKYRFASRAHATWRKGHEKREEQGGAKPAAKSSNPKKEHAPASLCRDKGSPPPRPLDGNDSTAGAEGDTETKLLEDENIASEV